MEISLRNIVKLSHGLGYNIVTEYGMRQLLAGQSENDTAALSSGNYKNPGYTVAI